MNSITSGYSTTNTQIELLWTEPVNGGSAILSYIVYYRLVGDVNFKELVGETSAYTLTEYTITHGVFEGQSYEFIVKAINRWGQATQFSNATIILAATVPEQVANLTSSIHTITGGLSVNWTVPLNRGANITTYIV
jgi:hypothetical protein